MLKVGGEPAAIDGKLTSINSQVQALFAEFGKLGEEGTEHAEESSSPTLDVMVEPGAPKP